MNKTYGATLSLSSTEGSSAFMMEVKWDKPIVEVLEEVGGEENLPPSYKMMIFLVDRVIALGSAFNEDLTLDFIGDASETAH